MIKLVYNDDVILELDNKAYDVEALIVSTPSGNDVRVDIPVRESAEVYVSTIPRPVNHLERLDYIKRLEDEHSQIARHKEMNEKEDKKEEKTTKTSKKTSKK